LVSVKYRSSILSSEEPKSLLADPNYLPESNLVATNSTGGFASACYGSIDPVHNNFTGRQEGWIFFLFTSPDFQRRGLARAMLFQYGSVKPLVYSTISTALGGLWLYSCGFNRQLSVNRTVLDVISWFASAQGFEDGCCQDWSRFGKCFRCGKAL
jgi:hypothetical protein